MPLMGIREYGRHRSVSHVAVLKAIRTGRIRTTADGLIDPEQADRQWAANTHPAPRAPRAVPPAVTDDFGFAKARTVREHYEALLAKHEYERRASQLLNAAEVKIASARTEQLFKSQMLRIPDGLAHQLAGVSDPHRVYEILSAEIRRALMEFAGGKVSGSEFPA